MSPPLYEKLDEECRQIRLIVIQPSPAIDAAIDCSLETFSLDDEPNYFALSNVWGDPTEDIIVNGFILPVTVNLVIALR